MAESGWPTKQTIVKTAAVASVVVASAVAFALNFGPQGAHAVPYASSSAAESASATEFPMETELFARAEAVLASDPTRALALTERMESLYPAGAMTQEREALAIRALERLGRHEEAETRSAALAERYPDSRPVLAPDAGSP